MSSLAYVAAPILGYLAAGALKFALNSLPARRLAFDQIGLGGMPSTHTTIVASAAATIGFRDGLDHPAFAAAFALLVIVAIDATDLRRKVGAHASVLRTAFPDDPVVQRLRTRMGHSPMEILAGLALGGAIGAVLA